MRDVWVFTSNVRSLACALILLPFFANLAFAQGLASIVGRVMDPSGAVVPTATVTAKETSTGFTRTATSSQEGLFAVPSLRPAEYELTVQAPGFRRYVQERLILQVDETLTVNVRMEVGATSESVTVEAAVTQVDLQSPTLKQVIEEKRINELPLNGRNAATLALLVGGVMDSPADGATQCCDKTAPGAVSYTSNGSRQNQIKLDIRLTQPTTTCRFPVWKTIRVRLRSSSDDSVQKRTAGLTS